ncbi:hypothetical protein Ancab_028221 [Ancistrocladus abbreviatus]
MASSAHSLISQSRTFTSLCFSCSAKLHDLIILFNPKFLSPRPPPPLHPLLSITNITVSASSVAKAIPPVELEDTYDSDSLNPDPSWTEFASKVSGEWDGHGADFTREGKPIELPESVVPEAYREWEVKVFDWQTQCPTLAQPEEFGLSYRLIRLLPTVGCEADAATIYSSDERNVGGEGNNALAFGYHSSGSYVVVWPVADNGSYKLLELEYCLIDPCNCESRVRIIQVVSWDNMKLSLQKIKVFPEQWYGPFKNGEQLGGCAIRDTGFASTDALKASEVRGVWQSHEAVARFEIAQTSIFQELEDDRKQKIGRDENDIVLLPRKLWCSLKENKNGETCGEVGWLLDNKSAISSRCIFSSDGKLKEMTVGHEVAAVDQEV